MSAETLLARLNDLFPQMKDALEAEDNPLEIAAALGSWLVMAGEYASIVKGMAEPGKFAAALCVTALSVARDRMGVAPGEVAAACDAVTSPMDQRQVH